MSRKLLYAELDRIFENRNRNEMEPTIRALLPILEENPSEPRVLYEVGGAYDTAGKGDLAIKYYEQALATGLKGDLRRRCALQYGSTLRSLGRTQESVRVFTKARTEFPDSIALIAFETLTLHAAGKIEVGYANLLTLIGEHVHGEDIERYKASLLANADYIREHAQESDASW